MPGSSYPYFKSKLKDYLKKKYSDKISILDVGAGEGVYSNLLRDMTNVMDAVEVFPLNIEVEQLHTKYDVVYETDIVKFKYTKKYDVIIFGDILEHLSVEDSKKVLKDALKNSKQIIIAVPYLSEQEISYGNKYEQHKQTDLTDSIFLNRYPEFETLFKNELYGYYTNKGMVPTVEKKLKIAFLDTIGLKYNGDTLKEKGLGGSESAIIYLGKELTKLGFEVTVFNKCDREGVYDGVEYVDLSKTVYNVEHYDILITSRTVLPYIPLVHRDTILQRYQGYDIANYKPLVDRSKYKVMWLHDTFILGEEWVENALADNFYDEIFTLSDWHTQYIVNANHGQEPRFFESMKRKIFQTRNGIKSYYDEVDISKKDKNLFIYNASATKGMVPLLDSIWPRVHAEYPSAKLLIIGGYYPGAASKGPDHIENIFHEKVAQNEGKRNVHFTGIIKQNEIADILVKASFFIYPGAFPETFGISATEALNYNVPLIASRFGALEETAPESTSYLAEYPIIRNMSNFNDNGSVADPSQVERFLIKVKQAYEDDFLRQQKMNAANEFKPFLG
jgi:glycosyltransferase involved in cell wall biosynthesis